MVSESLLPFCNDPSFKFFGFSDHKAALVSIDFSSFRRGPSFYKFNTSLLKNINFVNDVSKEIKRISSYNLNPHLCWDYIKVSVKDIAMSYGRALAFNKRITKKNLNIKLAELERHITTFPDDKNACKDLLEIQTKLELFLIQETEGARIRSGQKWAQDGEKCSKFFLNLGQQRSNANTLFSIEDSQSPTGLSSDPDVILRSLKDHFQKVYSTTPASDCNSYDNIFMDSAGANILDENDDFNLNSEISESEVLSALKLLNNNSAPGLDGLPCEIYKFFWNDLKTPLLSVFNHSFHIGHLSDSQCSSVICLHHKGKGQPREKKAS